DDDVGPECRRLATDEGLDPGHRRAGRIRLESDRLRVREQRDVGMGYRRPDPEDLGIGFGLDEAWEPIARGAPDTGARLHRAPVEADAARCVERAVPRPDKVVRQLLDAGLVRYGRERVRRARRWLGRILAALAMHLIELLGARVVRLELVIADRPGR